MGDRAQVQFKDNARDSVYFYTHNTGSLLPQTVANALARGRGRWDDAPYLARIVFSEMIQHEVRDELGYGISSTSFDEATIVVDVWNQTVTAFDGLILSFDEFVAMQLSGAARQR